VKWLTHPSWLTSLKYGSSTWGQEAEIAQEPGFALSFGVVLAMAGIILAITTWADYFPNPARNSAAPMPAKQAIYRAQHW